MMKRLGILITTDRHVQYADQLARSAYARGVEVSIYLMGPAVLMVSTEALSKLATVARIFICRDNAERILPRDRLPAGYQNHLMPLSQMVDTMSQCDRCVVF